MYILVSVISELLRTYIFPNPFTKLFELYFSGSALSSSASMLADIFNYSLGGIILYGICYNMVGIIYNKGEAPVLGSILYGSIVLINSKMLVYILEGVNELNLKLILIKLIIGLAIEIIILYNIRHAKKWILSSLYGY